jgi:hypothetical protein
MDAPASPAQRAPDVQLLQVWRADASPDGRRTGGQSAPSVETVDTSNAPPSVTPAKLRVEIDTVSGRFVHTLLDPKSQEVLAQYPNESQLAFSRAITAYVQSLRAFKP